MPDGAINLHLVELQTQYSNYKDTLQAIAQKIGDVEQENEEHKWVSQSNDIQFKLFLLLFASPNLQLIFNLSTSH